MPSIPLLVISSPMLIGPAPADAEVESSALLPVPTVAEAPNVVSTGHPQHLLALSWSLTQAQHQPVEPGQADPANVEDTGPEVSETANEADGTSIVVEGRYGPPEGDPIAVVNEASYRLTQGIDRALVEPLAYGYRDGLPGPVRDGLGNVVRNLREPSNFINSLLQFKIGAAVKTLGRFAINSTLGIGGLIDVAGMEGIGLPYRRNGFANTLGFYGVDTGAYLFLPIAGATTVRDFIGNTLDLAVLPVAVGKPFNAPEYAISFFVISNIENRLQLDNELAAIEGAVDPYAARRDSYLYYRAREIALLKGQEPPPPPEIVEEIEEVKEEIEQEKAVGADAETPQVAPLVSHSDTPEKALNIRPIAITRPRTR